MKLQYNNSSTLLGDRENMKLVSTTRFLTAFETFFVGPIDQAKTKAMV
jgi:hypothetical protein